jgi:hypothetical protein
VATPDALTLSRNRDLQGRASGIWWRRASLVVLAAIPALAVLNVFGQQPRTLTAASPEAQLSLHAPDRLRGGLLFSARFTIFAHENVKDARLVLDQGWAEEMAINTIEPSPVGEASANGRLSFDLGHIPKGQAHVLNMQFQVNPTNVVWHRKQNVELKDGDRTLLTIHRTINVFP